MTGAVISDPRRKGESEFVLWGASFGLVLALHGAVAAAAIGWSNASPPPTPPPAALILDLAPLPTAPAVTQTEIPPGPEQVQAAAPPPEPEPEPERIERPPPVEKAAVALPPPKPRVQPRREPPPQPVRERPPEPEASPLPPAPVTTAPQAAPVEAAVAAAPLSAPPSPTTANAMQTWQSLLRAQLERFKRYPASAQARRQQGVTYLRFVMDREGQVLSFRIERGSGIAALDEETLALIQRAQPLPKPPPGVGGATLELVVPVEFYMR